VVAVSYNSWKKNKRDITEVTEDWDFIIPADLMYSEVESRDELDCSSAIRERSPQAAIAQPAECVGAAKHNRFTGESQRDVVDAVSAGPAAHVDPQVVRAQAYLGPVSAWLSL